MKNILVGFMSKKGCKIRKKTPIVEVFGHYKWRARRDLNPRHQAFSMITSEGFRGLNPLRPIPLGYGPYADVKVL